MRFYLLSVFIKKGARASGCLCIVAFLLQSCDAPLPRNKSFASVKSSSIKKGQELAAAYCQSCHVLPSPSLLNAASWANGVLPQMGPRLGVFSHIYQRYPSSKADPLLDKNFYPQKPVVTPLEWQHIINYYTATAPDTLPPQQRTQPIEMNGKQFTAQNLGLNYSGAMTAFLKIDEADATKRVTVSDAVRNKLYFLNAALQPVDSVRTSGPVVGMELFENTMLACNIGVLNPNNGSFGKATPLHAAKNGGLREDSALFAGLKRPVQITPADLNNDGRNDFLVCEFGFQTGSLCWMETTANGTYKRHVLRALPGAIKAYIQDYNKDGLPDIWVLFAQGEEGIFLYTNKGNGTFSEQEVLRFPSVYGSSYFELADFNGDGHLDIVYTCGDNADYSLVLKPYHGVYVFLNNSKNGFTQSFFFPINGCYKALARDFDKDGDLDLATIAYFADYTTQPEEGFVYLENKGNLRFEPHSLDAAKQGRWLTMDAGDVDGDGWTDLVLGNFCLGPTFTKPRYDWRKAPPILLLKNKGRP